MCVDFPNLLLGLTRLPRSLDRACIPNVNKYNAAVQYHKPRCRCNKSMAVSFEDERTVGDLMDSQGRLVDFLHLAEEIKSGNEMAARPVVA